MADLDLKHVWTGEITSASPTTASRTLRSFEMPQGREKYSHRNGIRRRHEATTCSGNTGRSRNPASGVLVERESLLGAYTTTATKGAEARVAAAFQEWDEGRVIANVCATLRTPASRSRVHAHVYTLGSGTPVAGIRRRRRGRSQRSSERL
ncbi:hypothetical protein HPB52_006972 [Rhipicephalus sanguineus]|uniref:Uncharacterized protein n=1 Tax=Rhipicephalus sanguineus TaxID=34632 RepID=A0A9D4PQJ6_RHISA|nr:hypothetical protein HPB52_006972 [Rhipicephalus sanguineus]